MLFNRNCGCNRPCGGFGAPAFNPCGGCSDPSCVITEPTITKCVEKQFMHEVKHVCPIHTHVVNKNVFTHTYVPQYTCSEENQMVNVNCGSCSNF